MRGHSLTRPERLRRHHLPRTESLRRHNLSRAERFLHNLSWTKSLRGHDLSGTKWPWVCRRRPWRETLRDVPVRRLRRRVSQVHLVKLAHERCVCEGGACRVHSRGRPG